MKSNADIRIVIGRNSLPNILPNPDANLAIPPNALLKLEAVSPIFNIDLKKLVIGAKNVLTLVINLPIPSLANDVLITSKNFIIGENSFASLPPVKVFKNFNSAPNDLKNETNMITGAEINPAIAPSPKRVPSFKPFKNDLLRLIIPLTIV